MVSVLFGLMAFFFVLLSSILYFLNMVDPFQSDNRINLHCISGLISALSLMGHLITQPITGLQGEFLPWSAVGLFLIITASGVVLKYLPEAGRIRFHARSAHPALLVGLLIALLHHIVVKLG